MVFPYPERNSDGQYHVRFFSHGLRYVLSTVIQFIDDNTPPTRTALSCSILRIRTIRQQWRCALLTLHCSLGIAHAFSRLMCITCCRQYQPQYTCQWSV